MEIVKKSLATFIVLTCVVSCDGNKNNKELSDSSKELSKISHSGDTLIANLYYPSKQLKKRSFKVGDQYVGEHVEYYENGQLKTKVNYKNGLWHGAKIHYYDDGQIFRKMTYDKGVKSGNYEEYYKDGKIKYSGKADSLFTGDYFEYYDTGEKRLHIEVVKELHRKFKVFTRDGKIKDSGLIVKSGDSYTIRTKSDTIKLGEKYPITFLVTDKLIEKQAIIEFGELDDLNKLINKTGDIHLKKSPTTILLKTNKKEIQKTEGILRYEDKEIPFRVSVVVVE